VELTLSYVNDSMSYLHMELCRTCEQLPKGIL